VCGAYDVSRNPGLNLTTLRRYFIGNGFPTWLLSPFNTLLDLLSLPYINKGVYRLEDLPPDYQDEVKRLIQAANEANLVAQLEEAAKEHPRTMVFFRWYGVDKTTFLNSINRGSISRRSAFRFSIKRFQHRSILASCVRRCAFSIILTT
jgi:hypothetical protein